MWNALFLAALAGGFACTSELVRLYCKRTVRSPSTAHTRHTAQLPTAGGPDSRDAVAALERGLS